MVGQERFDVAAAIAHLSGQVTELQNTFESVPGELISEEEHEWIRTAIRREAAEEKRIKQSIEFRQAIISKTLAALIWAAIVGIGGLLWAHLSGWLKTHGIES
jgi:hypothetical protein